MGMYLNGLKICGNNVVDENPIGAIVSFAGEIDNSNYLYCDGRAVNRNTYKELFAFIGTTYGSGDGSTTFNLPNLKDKILQGEGDRAVLGTSINESLPNIKGTAKLLGLARRDWNHQYAGAFTSSGTQDASEGLSSGTYAGSAPDLDFNANKSSSVYKDGAKVQQEAVAVRFYIKAKKVYVNLSICPYEVGNVIEYLNDTDPNLIYTDTTWEKLSDRLEWDESESDLTLSSGMTGTIHCQLFSNGMVNLVMQNLKGTATPALTIPTDSDYMPNSIIAPTCSHTDTNEATQLYIGTDGKCYGDFTKSSRCVAMYHTKKSADRVFKRWQRKA